MWESLREVFGELKPGINANAKSSYDHKRSLFEQFAGKQPGLEDNVSPVRTPEIHRVQVTDAQQLDSCGHSVDGQRSEQSSAASPVFDDDTRAQQSPESSYRHPSGFEAGDDVETQPKHIPSASDNMSEDLQPVKTVLFSQSLFEGSPAYKQRRKKSSRDKRSRQRQGDSSGSQYDTGDEESGSDADSVQRTDLPFSSVRHDLGVSSNIFPQPHVPFYETPGRHTSHSTFVPDPIVNTPQSEVMISGAPVPNLHQTQADSWAPSSLSDMPHDTISHMPVFPPVDLEDRSQTLQSGIGVASQEMSSGVVAVNKGFSCPLLSCGRIFKRLEHLKRHVRTHTQERPYECNRCSKRFSRSDNLTQHIKTHEKADRGERLKTEASESTEDEMASYLEAEVDAMAAREGKMLGAVGETRHIGEPFRSSVGGDASVTGQFLVN